MPYTPKFGEMRDIAFRHASRRPNGVLDDADFIASYAESHVWARSRYPGSNGSVAWKDFLLYKGDLRQWQRQVEPYLPSTSKKKFRWHIPRDPRPPPADKDLAGSSPTHTETDRSGSGATCGSTITGYRPTDDRGGSPPTLRRMDAHKSLRGLPASSKSTAKSFRYAYVRAPSPISDSRQKSNRPRSRKSRSGSPRNTHRKPLYRERSPTNTGTECSPVAKANSEPVIKTSSKTPIAKSTKKERLPQRRDPPSADLSEAYMKYRRRAHDDTLF